MGVCVCVGAEERGAGGGEVCCLHLPRKEKGADGEEEQE